ALIRVESFSAKFQSTQPTATPASPSAVSRPGPVQFGWGRLAQIAAPMPTSSRKLRVWIHQIGELRSSHVVTVISLPGRAGSDAYPAAVSAPARRERDAGTQRPLPDDRGLGQQAGTQRDHGARRRQVQSGNVGGGDQ